MPSPQPAPRSDAQVPAYWRGLGLPGLVDMHVHFLPDRMQQKVWAYFDAGEQNYGAPWPVRYRLTESERLALLRDLGVVAFPSLPYPHKPGMAAWLNDWSADFARRTPDCVQSATLYPEPGVVDYVEKAIDDGARMFKIHVQVGGYDPADPVLDPVWDLLADARLPVTVHSGSSPIRGPHTGPEPVAAVLSRHPHLTAVIAHMGMHEYHEHLDLAVRFDRVHLDTTMFGTDYVEQFAPLPRDLPPRLADLRDRIVLGTDFPTMPYAYAHQIEALHRLDLGADWMRSVLYDNGARLLGLPPPRT
ncbi:MAG: amidohydrolase family protein [Geodermatophilaceae bacterium]